MKTPVPVTTFDQMIVSKDLSSPAANGSGAPLFVLGMWRSGTSLLYALLNQHPDIQLLYESELPLLWPLFLSPARNSWASRLDFWNGALRRHGIRPDAFPGSTDLSTAFATLGQQYAKSRGATIWGCKSPNYYVLVPKLARMFPHARYIFIWRDPSEICVSILRAADNSHWFRKRGMWRRVLVGCEMLKNSCDALRSSGAAVHELHYRELADDPDGELRNVCDFLGIPFSPRMTSLAGADLSAVYDGDHHGLLRNSNAVRGGRNGAQDILPPALKQKIARYKASWRSRFPDWKIADIDTAPTASSPASPRERCVDRLLFKVLQLDGSAPRWLFSFLPLRCWQMYRRIKYKDPDRYIGSPAMRRFSAYMDHATGPTTRADADTPRVAATTTRPMMASRKHSEEKL